MASVISEVASHQSISQSNLKPPREQSNYPPPPPLVLPPPLPLSGRNEGWTHLETPPGLHRRPTRRRLPTNPHLFPRRR